MKQKFETMKVPESTMKERNEEKYGDNAGDACVCCSKPIKAEKQTTFLHMTTDWLATTAPTELLIDNSQGFFPIGPECQRKFPKRFIHKI